MMYLACSKQGGLRALFLLVGIVLLSGCWPKEQHFNEIQGRTMGTFYQVIVEAPSGSQTLLQQRIDYKLQQISQTFSTYLPDSEINQLSQAAAGEWLAVSSDMLQVMLAAQQVYQQSSGAFDPTVRTLVDQWGFGPLQRADVIPDDQTLASALAEVGFSAVTIDAEQSKILKQQARQFELSGVAKGYAVDQIANFLSAQGHSNFLVNIGGDIRVEGNRRDGTPWRVAIEHPDQEQQAVYQTLRVTDLAVLTSGDYRNFFMVDGERFSHTLDPFTGFPIDHGLASVTVLAESAALADAWATAFTVLGFEASKALSQELAIPLLMLNRDQDEFQVYSNEFFQQALAE